MSTPEPTTLAEMQDGDLVTIAGQVGPDGRLKVWQVRIGDGRLSLRALPSNGWRRTTGRSRRAEARAGE